MDRYITRGYVTATPEEAMKLSRLDHTPPEQIKHTPDVEPLHTHSGWSYWSDGKIINRTNGTSLPRASSLTADAESLIDTVLGSDSGHVDGGVTSLVTIEKIMTKLRIDLATNTGHYNPPNVEVLHIRYTDGTEGDLWTFSQGYFEGYVFDIYRSMEALQLGLKDYNIGGG